MTAAKETTLNQLSEMIERGFKAVADDVGDIRKDRATKEDVRVIVREELAPLETRLRSIESEAAAIHRYLDDLSEKYHNVSGFRKEIDHALERIAAIERHLKINEKKIAA